MTALIGGIVLSIVPSTPSGVVAIVASVMVTLIVATFAFLALAPLISETWSEQLSSTADGGPSIDQTANDAD